jgi:probable HAF family extracellular repeat protein
MPIIGARAAADFDRPARHPSNVPGASMTFRFHCAPCAVAAALALAAGAAPAAPLYHLTDLGPSSPTQIAADGTISGTWYHLVGGNYVGDPALWRGSWQPLAGGQTTVASGVNGKGTAVGTIGLGEKSHYHPAAVVWKPSGKRVGIAPDATQSFGYVIRSDGTVYGMLQPPTGHATPFRWRSGTLTTMPFFPGWTWTKPFGANKSGEIAAQAQDVVQDGVCPAEPVLFTGGAWVDLGSLGGTCGGARAVNDAGIVVGLTSVAGSDAGHAFSWQNGVMTDLGSLGGGYAWADDINADGVIVGYSADAALNPHAVVWRSGAIKALDAVVDQLPDGTMIEAVSINALGQIVVNGVGHDGQLHTYRLDPL